MSSPPYVPLVVLGHHSLLRGTFSPERLVAACVRLGLDTCALTDRNSLMGVVPFIQAARQAGLRPLVGVDLETGGMRLTVLARNRRGYAACCELVSCIQSQPRMDLLREVSRRIEDLEVLCADPALLPRVHGALEGRHLQGVVMRLPGRRPERLARVARVLGVPLVAAGDVRCLKPSELPLQRVLRAMARASVVERLPAEELAPPEACLLGHESMAARHEGEEELLSATRRVAESCHFEIELGTPIFPILAAPPGETPISHLSRLARAGARSRYGQPLPPAVESRLQNELAVIEEMGFSSYFLIVREILEFARKQRIPFVGRGSAADSLVVFCLGFTRVDPLRHGLIFERFLSRGRRSLPDIDVDFCWRRRDEVVAFIYRRFGTDRVATISTHCSLRFRSAFRETAKALGLPPPLVEQVAKALPHGHAGSLSEALAHFSSGPVPVRDARLARVLKLAEALRGIPHHLGMHPGGMVIADRPLTWYTPVVPSAKGPPITQLEMRAIASLGLVKMDILGQRSLSTIQETLEILRQSGQPVPKLHELPAADTQVRALMQEGRSIGCFQVESPGMRRLLQQMRAQNRRDVIDAVALIRPGASASGMKEHYIRRARGLEPLMCPHPAMASVLRKSFGVMLYQEDILRVCQAVAGWSLEEGDLLRNALGKQKDPLFLADLRVRFFKAAVRRGVPRPKVREIWRMLGSFAAFSYCKAHAVTYGYLAYEELWLKAHHPAAFLCAVINNERGYYPDRVYLEEALRLGVRFRLPDLNRSGCLFKLEPEGCIRIGLGRVRQLSRKTLKRLLEERQLGGPFLSLRDFITRVRPSSLEAGNLIRAGALDLFDHTRPELLWKLELLARRPVDWKKGAPELFALPPQGPSLPRLPDLSEKQKRQMEFAVLGLTAEGGAALFQPPKRCLKRVQARDLAAHVGRTVSCFGWCSATRRTPTASGRWMAFLTLEDATGTIEGVLFPDIWLRFRQLLVGEGPYLIRGRVEAQLGALTVHIIDLQHLAPAGFGAFSRISGRAFKGSLQEDGEEALEDGDILLGGPGLEMS